MENSSLLPKVIRVAYARNPPDAFTNCLRFPSLLPSVECPFPGYTVEITAYAGLDIVPVLSLNVVGSIDWGSVQNGSWVGVLGMLANDTADVACLMYQMTELRESNFAFSYPLTNVQPVYVVRRQKADLGSVLWNAFKPYSTMTWVAILASFIAQVVMMIGIARVEKLLRLRERSRPFEIIWQCIQLQLDEHSEDMQFHTIAGNIVMFFCALLQAGLLIKLYEGLLLSALLAPPDSDPFKNAAGLIALIAKKQYQLVTNYAGNWYFESIRSSNAAHFVALRAATANNPVVIADNVSHALDLVEQGPFVYPIQYASLARIISGANLRPEMSKERCNLVYVSDGLPQVSSYFVMQNDSVFLAAMNKAIIMNLDFVQRTFNKYFRDNFKLGTIPKCDTSEFDVSVASKPLDLASTVGIFTLSAIGIVCSIIVFFIEIYIFLHNRILQRRRAARNALARNLIALGKLYFTELSNGIGLMRLADLIDKALDDRELQLTEPPPQ